MSGSCVRMVKSSAYVVMIVLSVVGWGISAVKRLKRQGERIAPWGTPFLMCTSLDIWPFEMTLAVLPVRKFAIHFLRLFSMCVFSIFCMRRYVGTVSNALFMSIAISMDRFEGFVFSPFIMGCEMLSRAVVVECCFLKPC